MAEDIINQKYMRRCLELASRGLGTTRANPLVGSVVVHEDKIIGEGFHQLFGGPHAEAVAINSIRDKKLLEESVLFVNLEPCHHHGKTPPCSLLIRDSGIKKVVLGSRDPNPLVSGKGIRFLRNNGLNVKTGVLSEECIYLNRRFFTFHREKRPYVILKWAESRDGYLDNRNRNDNNRPPARITSDRSNILSHKWRAEEMAIMVGTHTANMDNPSLTVRFWSGENPLRLTFERNTPLRKNLKLLNDGYRTIVYTKSRSVSAGNIEYVNIDESDDTPESVLSDLYKRNIISLIVEGGAGLLNSFIKYDIWDEVRILTGQGILGKGIKAPLFSDRRKEYKTGKDNAIIFIK